VHTVDHDLLLLAARVGHGSVNNGVLGSLGLLSRVREFHQLAVKLVLNQSVHVVLLTQVTEKGQLPCRSPTRFEYRSPARRYAWSP